MLCILEILNLTFQGTCPLLVNTAPEKGAVYSEKSELDFSGHVSFTGNTAPEGGAVYSKNSELDFSGHVSFTGNTAPEKGAVCSENSELNFSGHVSFIGNTADLGGALTAVNSVVSFKGMTSFENNQADIGGAVYAVSSRLKISGNIDFRMNHASKGGAIYDIGSQLVLQTPVAVSFHNNTASSQGGALFVEYFRCRNIFFETCFFEVQSASSIPTQDISLEFTGNSANAGSVLCGGDLDNCNMHVNAVQQDFTGFQFLKNVTIISSKNSLPAITSDPYRICLCTTDGITDCDKKLLNLSWDSREKV